MYDNPVTIVRERASTDDLYTVPQKQKTVSSLIFHQSFSVISLTIPTIFSFHLRVLKAKKMIQKQKVNYLGKND